MSIYCGASFGGGQGYTDTCGKEEYGKGTPLAQCKQCMKMEIHNLKAENESMAKRLLFVDIVHGPKAEMRWAALVNENESLRKDAERYRWVKKESELSSYEDSYALPIVHAWEYKPGPELNEQFASLDDAIDYVINSSPENP